MTTHINKAALGEMEKRQRANFINSLGGFKSVSLIGTADPAGATNLAIFSSVVHLGANPPLVAFIVRPDTADRHTLNNIMETGFYTINHINPTIVEKAHQTSARYSKETSEYDAVGLSREFIDEFAAPFVQESAIKFGVAFRERIDLSINNTIFMIGEIIQVHFPTECWCEDGFLDIEKAATLTCSGLDSYHQTQRIKRLSYAKADAELTQVHLQYKS